MRGTWDVKGLKTQAYCSKYLLLIIVQNINASPPTAQYIEGALRVLKQFLRVIYFANYIKRPSEDPVKHL